MGSEAEAESMPPPDGAGGGGKKDTPEEVRASRKVLGVVIERP